jgi:hypothetical protein
MHKALIYIVGSLPAVALAMSVSIKWDANSEPDLAGYKVYYKEPAGAYRLYTTIQPPATSAVMHNLSSNRKYIVALTAFNNVSSESARSNRVPVNFPVATTKGNIRGQLLGTRISNAYD